MDGIYPHRGYSVLTFAVLITFKLAMHLQNSSMSSLDLHVSWTQRVLTAFTRCSLLWFSDLSYGIFKGQFHTSGATIAPGMILTLLSAFIDGTYMLVGYLSHGLLLTQRLLRVWDLCHDGLLLMYVVFFIPALITTISEYKHFHVKKKWRIFTTLYVPIFT